MSNFKLQQNDNELIFTVKGQDLKHTLIFNDKDEASRIKPDIRDLIWAIERTYKDKDQ